MSLEAVMICLDNSESMRNGDYSPNRFYAQNEAANFICTAKVKAHGESSVGFLAMAGRRVEVFSTLTREMSFLMKCMQDVKIDGEANFVAALKTAQLVLRNRQNKNQRQRIIMFVGSPVGTPVDDLVQLAKSFKKSAIAVDVINFGDENTSNGNAEKLETFINTVNSDNNSRIITVPPGPHVFSDVVLSSPLFTDNAAAQGAPGAAAAGPGLGVDPNLDPEMAMAIRMSMEEARRDQEARVSQAKQQSIADNSTAAAPSDLDDNEQAIFAQAIAMSMQADNMDVSSPSKPGNAPKPASPDNAPKPANPNTVDQALNDPNFINDLLQSVGVDKNQIQMSDLLNQDKNKDKDKDKDKSPKKSPKSDDKKDKK